MKIWTLVTLTAAFFLPISVALATDLPILPDSSLTPGDVLVTSTKDKICTVGYTSTIRNVPDELKKEVFKEYNIDPKSDKFEIDHLISLELGGSNDIKNLWPQSYTTMPWNAHKKDALENKLHKMICNGTITITEAQEAISKNWIDAYKKYIGE